MEVLFFIRFEKNRSAVHDSVGGIDIVEDLRSGSLNQSRVAVDIKLCALFFTLVAIENAQRDIDADPNVLVNRWVAAAVETEDWIRRPVSDGEPMIGLRLFDRLYRGSQIRPRIQSHLAHVVKR